MVQKAKKEVELLKQKAEGEERFNAGIEAMKKLDELEKNKKENSEEAFLTGYRELYRQAEKAGVAVAIGGRVLVEAIRSKVPYTTYGDGLGHLAAFARTLHPRPGQPRRGRPKRV